jgi:hypothetical protein
MGEDEGKRQKAKGKRQKAEGRRQTSQIDGFPLPFAF